ncbi:uncharacterized protein [Drosophila suzukii]|uniref:Uncharacterized protein isoform X6 n=1 Tax=Drosophila suzukii TaxID=28584 RepID=A0ABM4TYV8_DROSZ
MALMDIELKKINKLETTKKINMIDMKCDMVKTGKHKYQLTEKGTSSLCEHARVSGHAAAAAN